MHDGEWLILFKNNTAWYAADRIGIILHSKRLGDLFDYETLKPWKRTRIGEA